MNTRRLTLDIPGEVFTDLERIAAAASDKSGMRVSPFGTAEVLLCKAVFDFCKERDGESVVPDQAS